MVSKTSMGTIKHQIEALGTSTTSDELNEAYNQLSLAISNHDFEGITTRSEIERTLNHIANYNLVRIANKAAEDYESSGRSDRSLLIEIGRCRDSLKDHDDKETEQELLDNLCDALEIR